MGGCVSELVSATDIDIDEFPPSDDDDRRRALRPTWIAAAYIRPTTLWKPEITKIRHPIVFRSTPRRRFEVHWSFSKTFLIATVYMLP